MSTKLERTIARNDEKIAAGEFYDAHQGIRTVANRYVKQKAYNEAIEVLYKGAESLLKAKQYASASDLVLYILEVYTVAEVAVDSVSRNRLISLIQLFDVHEPTLVKISNEADTWSGQFGPVASGDAILHNLFGSVFAQADEGYEAEKNLLLGTKESAAVLGKLLWDWSEESKDAPLDAPLFLSRGVLGYLCTENIRDADKCSETFLGLFNSKHKPETNSVEAVGGTITTYDSVPLFNFLQLLILACRSKNPETFKRLTARYAQQLGQLPAWGPALDKIGQVYFGIVPKRQGNMLEDLMGSFFK